MSKNISQLLDFTFFYKKQIPGSQVSPPLPNCFFALNEQQSRERRVSALNNASDTELDEKVIRIPLR